MTNDVEVNNIVQITDKTHHWFPALVIVTEIKSFGIQGFCFIPKNDGTGGEAYIRLNKDKYELVGIAVIVPDSEG